MFCSSLRARQDWATAVPALLRSAPPRWKESRLDTHDVAFPTARGGRTALFRVLLLSSADSQAAPTKDRIDRLYELSSGRHVAIGLLMPGDGDTTCLMELQMNAVPGIPIVPIVVAAELPAWLDQLRRECNADAEPCRVDTQPPVLDLVSRCARGAPLEQGQVKTLMESASSLAELAQLACDSQGQTQLCHLLGEDGVRVASFFRMEDPADTGF